MGYWKKRKDAFGYAIHGVVYLMKNEAHAKIHLLATICVVAAGFIFNISAWEWCAVITCIGTVLAGEAGNTAVEKLADKISKEKDPLIGIAKDVAAGAVFMLAIMSVIVGLIIFLPKIGKLII